MLNCSQLSPHDLQDRNNVSAADLEKVAKTYYASDTIYTSFADLLQQLSQVHDREVAQLRLEIVQLKSGSSPCMTPQAFVARTNSEMVIQTEATRSHSDMFADTSLPSLSLSQVVPICVNSDFQVEEDTEIAQEKSCNMFDELEPAVALLSNYNFIPAAQRPSRSEGMPEFSSLSHDSSAHISVAKHPAQKEFPLLHTSLRHKNHEQRRTSQVSLASQNDEWKESHSALSSSLQSKRDPLKLNRQYSKIQFASSSSSLSSGNYPQYRAHGIFSENLEKWHRLISFAKNGSNYVKLDPGWQMLAHENLTQSRSEFVLMVQKFPAQSWALGETRDSASSFALDFRPAMSFHKTWLKKWSLWFQQTAEMLETRNVLILHPNSWLRMVWDLMGMVLLIHDVVMIPLQVFDSGTDGLGEEYLSFWAALDFVASIFWTCDIFVSFVTAFYSDEGFVEVDHWKIARHYLKSWFPLDLGIVAIDWVGYLLNFNSEVGFLRLGKAISRFLRVLRLLRLMKLSEKFNEVIESVNSEYIYTLVGVLKLLLGIIMVNHYIACTWYWLSQIDATNTWSTTFLNQNKDFDYAYVTSMHWSLTQFTPASMEVYPTNTYERVYTIVVIVGAMVTFSSFVSSITDAMTHLRTINAQKSETDAGFRQYFSRNNVSLELARHVWHVRRRNFKANQSRMKESDLPALNFLPSYLREMLRMEVFYPILQAHPFFRLLFDVCPNAVMQICTKAVSERQVLPGEDSEITNPIRKMLFVCGGVLIYFFDSLQTGVNRDSDSKAARGPSLFPAELYMSESSSIQGRRTTSSSGRRTTVSSAKSDQSLPSVKIRPGQWACEVSLWSDEGAISGPFFAGDAGCDLVLLSGEKFRSILQKHTARDGVQLTAYYAKIFIDRFNGACLDPEFQNILFNDESMLYEFLAVVKHQMQERFESLQK